MPLACATPGGSGGGLVSAPVELITPMRAVPVVPCGIVRASRGKLFGETGALAAEFGAGGISVAPWAKAGAAAASASAKPAAAVVITVLRIIIDIPAFESGRQKAVRSGT